MSLSEELIKAATVITPLTSCPKHTHLRQAWEMILGGLILPLLVKDIPEILDDEKKTLMELYTKKKVIEFFTPKEVIVEKEVEVERIIPSGDPIEKVTTRIVRIKDTIPKIGGKYRRIKGSISKEKKKEESLRLEDRDIFIRYWNLKQDLVSKDDPVCDQLAKECSHSIAPAQVAGYFSHLCRLGRETEATRTGRIERALKRGTNSVTPVYSQDLIEKIQKNWKEEREDKRIRAEAHARIMAGKTPSDIVEVVSETSTVKEVTPTVIPSASSPIVEPDPEEEFDIKFM